MSFDTRIICSQKLDNIFPEILRQLGFIVEKSGYESFISPSLISELRTVHNDLSVRFLRYLPDYFVKYKDKYFFLELKVMDTPIKFDSRVNDLRQSCGISTLSKENIGVVETNAIKNYDCLSQIGVKILVVVYCSYHHNKILIDWEQNISKFYNDKVRLGQGDASFTPYTNINLDQMRSVKEFFEQEFQIYLEQEQINKLIEWMEQNG
jgi:hypothetical protein